MSDAIEEVKSKQASRKCMIIGIIVGVCLVVVAVAVVVPVVIVTSAVASVASDLGSMPAYPPPAAPPPPCQSPSACELAEIRRLSTSSGPAEIYDTMALNTADPGDADLGELVQYGISDISAVWGYHQLEQPKGGEAMPILMFYLEGHSPASSVAYNAQTVAQLDARFSGLDGGCMEDICGAYGSTCSCDTDMAVSCCSSSVMGNGNVKLVRLQYNEIEPMQRAALVVHEYYHVVQLAFCGEPKSNPNPNLDGMLVWLWEGTATAVQYLWVIHNLQDDPEYKDHLFGKGTGPSDPMGRVKETINEFGGGYVFGTANEQYSGVSRNYQAETTAALYLAKMTSPELVFKTFLTRDKCAPVYAAGKSAAFAAEFGAASTGTAWGSLQDFYDDFNTFMATLSAPDELKPSADELSALFSNTLLCSDVCETANNGVCDAGCLYGSDCTDCGGVEKPAVFPVTLRAGCTHTAGQCDE